MLPVVRELEAEYAGRVDFRILDYYDDENNALKSGYAVRYHPGFVVLRPDGSAFPTLIGPQPREKLVELLEAALA